MEYDYDLQKIKESLTIDEVELILTELGGEPVRNNGNLVSRTICHNGDSHKLYWFSNSNLFHCFTDCGTSFDIFELVRKVMSREQPKQREDSNWNLPEAVEWVARKFGFAPNIKDDENQITIKDDLIYLKNFDRIKDININSQQIELKEYQAPFLKYMPRIKFEPWIREGIKPEVMEYHNLCYDAKNQGIIIPHYDINNRLVGIRERTIVEENEAYGKYRPAYIGGKLYNHPLGFCLYNLNNVQYNIKQMEKVIVFEGEKSCLQFASYFGKENDLTVACCGSSFSAYQAWLLINQGVKEIIIGLDKQYKEPGDDEHKKLVKNLKNIHKKFGQYVQISYLFDTGNLLQYKASPTDAGAEIFKQLFKERKNIYND